MRGPVGWGDRAGWSLLGALACLLPAAAAHAAAGGALPGLGILSLMLAVLAVPGAVISGSRLRHRFEAAVAVLAFLQLLLHECFHALAPMPSGGSGHDTGMAGMAGMGDMAGMSGMPGMDMTGTAGTSAAVHGVHGSMAAWHTVATVTSAVTLLHGSRLLRRLAELLLKPRLPFLAALFAAPALPAPPRPVFAEPGLPAIGVRLARSLSRRGPPPARA